MSSVVYLTDPAMPDVELDVHTCGVCSAVADSVSGVEFTNARLWEVPTERHFRSHSWQFTWNYRPMLEQVGEMVPTWHEMNEWRAGDAATEVADVLRNLIIRREMAEKLNPPNGWGRYDLLVPRLADMVKMCVTHPDYTIEVS